MSSTNGTLAKLYLAHKDRLLTIAVAMLRDRVLAEDVLHDVFTGFARDPARLLSARSMPKYLVACVRNRARTVIREKQALDRKRAGKAEGGAAEQNDASSAMESDDESAKLMDLLAGLPADLREVLALRMWGGLKFREIEVETGLSKSIVYKRYQEAIAALRRRMAKE